MTAPATVLDHDPDVLQAIEDLGSTARRLHAIEEDLLATDEVSQHRKWMGLRAAAGQCRDTIKARAERIGITAPTLLHILDEDARLRARYRRKPSRNEIVRALTDSISWAERAEREARVASRIAEIAHAQASRHANAARAALPAFEGRAQP